MASPFYLFRKYQKSFLVVAGVLAMFIFVLADPLMSWLQSASGGGGGPRSAATVVATWDGGSLNVRQLDNLAQRRYKISQFLTTLVGSAAAILEQEGGSPLAPTLPDFRLQQDTDPRAIQVGCVTTRVLAELASQSGITVSDGVVNHYLREWGLRRMGDAQIATILGRLGMSDKMLFAGLRELMLGNFYINSYALATRGVMPEERWQDWKRINERIAVEAAVLPAEKFIAAMAEPTESQLQQFYELHKEKIEGIPQFVMGAQLPSPDPGFREPRRVRLQYLVANVDDATQRLLDTVTEAEIVDYYERNKRAQFIKTSTISPGGLFDDLAGETGAEETEAEGKPTSETFVADSEAATEKGDSSVEDSGESPGETSTETSAATSAATSAGEEEPVVYEPLEKVREQIRRSLAKDKAVVELQKIVDRTYASLQSAYNPYGFKVVSARTEANEIPAPPAELSDYIAIAKQTGLTSEETVLLSQMELAETYVGKAFDAQSRREFVVQSMFGDQELYEPYRAIDLDGNSYIVCKTADVPSSVPAFEVVRDRALTAWKEQEAAQSALAKAEDLAKKAGESSDTVTAAARAAGYETVTTDMFSWLTFGTTQAEMQRGPRLGDAPPLEAIGVDFMTKAFKLKPDEAIALLNHDRSVAYVVQLDRREQTEAEMRQQFLAEANNWYGGRVMNSARWGASQRQLLEQLSEQTGLNLDKLEEVLSGDSQ